MGLSGLGGLGKGIIAGATMGLTRLGGLGKGTAAGVVRGLGKGTAGATAELESLCKGTAATTGLTGLGGKISL